MAETVGPTEKDVEAEEIPDMVPLLEKARLPLVIFIWASRSLIRIDLLP